MMSELDLYITNTETIYSEYEDDFDGVAVRLYGRTSEGDEKKVTVTNFPPYFFVPADEQDVLKTGEHDDLERYEATDVVPLEDRFKDSIPGEESRELVKVVADHPGAIPKLRDHWDTTWGADVQFTNRFRIDKDIRSGVTVAVGNTDPDERYHFIVDHRRVSPTEITDAEPRFCIFDIETDDRDSGFPSPGDARILSIAAYDSYEGEYVAFLDTGGQEIDEKFGLEEVPDTLSELGIEEVDSLNYAASEKRMLNDFSEWLTDCDPDIVGGWNSGDTNADGFDLPHVVERMKAVGLNPDRLSRDGYTDADEYDGDWTVEIKGRSTYDFMDAWASTKFTKPDSKKLDRVAEDKLDDAKIEHADQGFFEMYEDDPTKFLNYNGKDTRLTVDITEEESVVGFKERLKDMVGVDWEEVRENRDFISMSVRRKCHEHDLVMVTARDNPRVRAASSNDSDDVNYEGAHVFPAFTGVKANVVGIDLASLYPMTQWMLNASPDTKIDRKVAWKHDIPHVVAENGAAFRTDVDSIIRELVDEYDETKMVYKRKLKEATPGTEEHEMLANTYGVAKTIYNSYYGYTGWDKSPIYDPEIAEAVTLTGQVVIKTTADHLEENTHGEIVYGDTDSTYSEWPSEWSQERTLRMVETVCEELNDEIYPDLCNDFLIDPADNRWEIELEMFAKRFFMSGSKKKYAYLETWAEGMEFDEVLEPDEVDLPREVPDDDIGEFEVTGYQCIKSNFAQITKDTQETMLETIVRGGTKGDVTEIVHSAAASIDAADPDWERLGMPQGLGKKLSEERVDKEDYYAWSQTRETPQDAHPRGAWFANQLLDVEFGQDDKPKRAYLKETLTVGDEPVDVLCYEYDHDLEPVVEDVQMDVSKMQDKVLLNPMEDILDAMELEPEAALQGKSQSQESLGVFM